MQIKIRLCDFMANVWTTCRVRGIVRYSYPVITFGCRCTHRRLGVSDRPYHIMWNTRLSKPRQRSIVATLLTLHLFSNRSEFWVREYRCWDLYALPVLINAVPLPIIAIQQACQRGRTSDWHWRLPYQWVQGPTWIMSPSKLIITGIEKYKLTSTIAFSLFFTTSDTRLEDRDQNPQSNSRRRS